MKHLAILGSTGSIGRSTLALVAQFPEQFRVTSLAAKHSIDLLAQQIERFHPQTVAVYDKVSALKLEKRLASKQNVEIRYGTSGYKKVASHPEVDIVVTAVVGAAGLLPTLAAIDTGKKIALANKETLVMAGDLVMQRAAEKGVQIIPVDSEHSAIFQCLQGNRRQDVDHILLTASGGPFRQRKLETFQTIRPESALCHPNWQMGAKITIDSATLMNKGLEVIEARHLFKLKPHQIQVIVHPQSIVHSMVAYRDGAVMAQMGVPDMKGAIAYALSYPRRLPSVQPMPDFIGLGRLTFEAPDLKRFPCLALAWEACTTGGTLPAVLNAANEITVAAFLDRTIGFTAIPKIIERVMERSHFKSTPDLEAILNADRQAREDAANEIKTLKP